MSILKSICVKRGKNTVLEQINLRIGAGEWVLLCGPSGAGKSSLLRLLAGLDAHAKGEMSRLGKSIPLGADLYNRLDGRVALLVQNPEHHFIATTVAEDIMWGLIQRDTPVQEARASCIELAKALRIDHLLERPCHTLSFGEQRRAALAGLLVMKPALLLLDEPTAGLDPVASNELIRLVEELIQGTDTICVWATHDLHSIPLQANRTILLKEGRVIFDGDTKEGLSHAQLVRAGLALPKEQDSCC